VLRSDTHSGTTWVAVGETPVVATTGVRFSVNMVSAVGSQGQLCFMLFAGGMNAERFVEFLKRLIQGAKQPVSLILHPVHKSNCMREFLDNTDGRLRLLILPPHAPQLNPDEWVWNWLKRHRIGKAQVRGHDQFRALVRRCLRRLQKLPSLVRGFFADPNLAYIHTA
jgi:transposase